MRRRGGGGGEESERPLQGEPLSGLTHAKRYACPNILNFSEPTVILYCCSANENTFTQASFISQCGHVIIWIDRDLAKIEKELSALPHKHRPAYGETVSAVFQRRQSHYSQLATLDFTVVENLEPNAPTDWRSVEDAFTRLVASAVGTRGGVKLYKGVGIPEVSCFVSLTFGDLAPPAASGVLARVCEVSVFKHGFFFCAGISSKFIAQYYYCLA